MNKVEPNVLSEEKLSFIDKETREVAQMLNSLETILEISIQFRNWGNQKHSDVLKEAIETISNLLFGEIENVTEEEAETIIKLSIKEIQGVATLLKEWGNTGNGDLLNEASENLFALIFGVDFYKDWDKIFEICHKIAIENDDIEFADEIQKYIGIPKDQELGENFVPLLKRCINAISNY
jgi:hypothetical protein